MGKILTQNIMNCNSLSNLFRILNEKKVNYVILRNWENFFDELLIEGHNDIDILCYTQNDKQQIIRIFNATPAKNNFYSLKYKFQCGDNVIFLDFRFIGDGYYCKKWESNMVKTRKLNEKGFYTLDQENYFYSLAYHAIIHKNHLSETYNQLLKKSNLNQDFYIELLNYMKSNHYYISVPLDRHVGQFNLDFFSKYIRIKREFCSFINYQKIRFQKHLKK